MTAPLSRPLFKGSLVNISRPFLESREEAFIFIILVVFYLQASFYENPPMTDVSFIDLKDIALAKRLIEEGKLTKAHAHLQRAIDRRPNQPCTTLKALRALCIFQSGHRTDARQHAEELLEHTNFHDVSAVEIIAFLCVSASASNPELIAKLIAMYRSAWKETASQRIGEKLASAFLANGDFSAFHHIALQLSKVFDNRQYQTWIILGKCLCTENVPIQSLGLKILWRTLCQCLPAHENSARNIDKLFDFYIRNAVANNVHGNLLELVHSVLLEKSVIQQFTIGSVLMSVINAYFAFIENNEQGDVVEERLIFSLCVYLLSSDSLCKKLEGTDPRRNFKFLKYILQFSRTFEFGQQNNAAGDGLRKVFDNLGSEAIKFYDFLDENPKRAINAIKIPDWRTRKLFMMHKAFIFDEEHQVIQMLREYTQTFSCTNLWCCVMDIEPIVEKIIRQNINMPGDISFASSSLLDAFADRPELHLRVYLWMKKFMQNDHSEQLKVLIKKSLRNVLNGKESSTFHTFLIVEAIIATGDPRSQTIIALAFLDSITESSHLTKLLRLFLAGELGLTDGDVDICGTCSIHLNNAQWDTLGSIFLSAAKAHCSTNALAWICSQAIEFYRTSLGADSLHVTETALQHGEWNMVQHDLPTLQHCLKFSICRLEYIVWDIIAKSEEMSVLKAVAYLKRNENQQMIDHTHDILENNRASLRWNEDSEIIGEWSQAVAEHSKEERVDTLWEMVQLLRLAAHGEPSEFFQGTKVLNAYLSRQRSMNEQISKLSERHKRLCLPGIRLVLYALHSVVREQPQFCQNLIHELKAEVQSATAHFAHALSNVSEKYNFPEASMQFFPDDLCYDMCQAFVQYAALETRGIKKWQALLKTRLEEIQSFESEL